jgi:cytochrome P450
MTTRTLRIYIFQGDYWKDGTEFRPERFISADGAVKKDDHLIPFSVGKRQCLGETLAKVELFLFFTGRNSLGTLVSG